MKPVQLKNMKRTNVWIPKGRVWYQKNDDFARKSAAEYRKWEQGHDNVMAQRMKEARVEGDRRIKEHSRERREKIINMDGSRRERDERFAEKMQKSAEDNRRARIEHPEDND